MIEIVTPLGTSAWVIKLRELEITQDREAAIKRTRTILEDTHVIDVDSPMLARMIGRSEPKRAVPLLSNRARVLKERISIASLDLPRAVTTPANPIRPMDISANSSSVERASI